MLSHPRTKFKGFHVSVRRRADPGVGAHAGQLDATALPPNTHALRCYGTRAVAVTHSGGFFARSVELVWTAPVNRTNAWFQVTVVRSYREIFVFQALLRPACPCANGTVCVSNSSSVCGCRDGWGGERCDVRVVSSGSSDIAPLSGGGAGAMAHLRNPLLLPAACVGCVVVAFVCRIWFARRRRRSAAEQRTHEFDV